MFREVVSSMIATGAVFQKSAAGLVAITIVDHQAKSRSHQDLHSAILCSIYSHRKKSATVGGPMGCCFISRQRKSWHMTMLMHYSGYRLSVG